MGTFNEFIRRTTIVGRFPYAISIYTHIHQHSLKATHAWQPSFVNTNSYSYVTHRLFILYSPFFVRQCLVLWRIKKKKKNESTKEMSHTFQMMAAIHDWIVPKQISKQCNSAERQLEANMGKFKFVSNCKLYIFHSNEFGVLSNSCA